ncbi:MAG: magnesium transporter [Firmicutes bacterium]|nr:magnesium transporter [Bacillota bacterium]
MAEMNLDRDLLMEEGLEKILSNLDEKKYFSARDEILKFNSVDIAELLEEVTENSGIQMTVILFRMLPKDVSVEVFAELPVDDRNKIVDIINDKEIEYIIKELDFDDKIDVLEELPANVVSKILESTPKSERRLINTFLNYPDNCAGTIMTPDYISLKKDWSVREALDHIKREGMDAETIYTCYVKDMGRKLIGIVSLSTLVISDDDIRIKDIMRTEFVYENVYEDQEKVAADFTRYGFLAIPVVDNEFRLVGIITVDDILDIIEEETTEDIERMGGIIDFDDSDRGYLDVPVIQHVLNRLPWLVILMIAYVFTGMIITSFEGTLSQVISLVAYMPMLMGTGGNTGSQAATLIIRGLATDEVEPEDFGKVLWKEIRVGLIIGVLLSAINFLRIVLFDHEGSMVALTVCTAMICIVIFAKMLGSMIPLIVKKLGADPALIANPAISSISDAVALTIYFLMAKVFLGL